MLGAVTQLCDVIRGEVALWGWQVVLLDYSVGLSDFVVWLCFMVFLWRTRATYTILRLYPFRVRLLLFAPLSGRWRKELAPEHVQAIERLRRGYCTFFGVILALGLLKYVYYKFFFVRLHALS